MSHTENPTPEQLCLSTTEGPVGKILPALSGEMRELISAHRATIAYLDRFKLWPRGTNPTEQTEVVVYEK